MKLPGWYIQPGSSVATVHSALWRLLRLEQLQHVFMVVILQQTDFRSDGDLPVRSPAGETFLPGEYRRSFSGFSLAKSKEYGILFYQLLFSRPGSGRENKKLLAINFQN